MIYIQLLKNNEYIFAYLVYFVRDPYKRLVSVDFFFLPGRNEGLHVGNYYSDLY